MNNFIGKIPFKKVVFIVEATFLRCIKKLEILCKDKRKVRSKDGKSRKKKNEFRT